MRLAGRQPPAIEIKQETPRVESVLLFIINWPSKYGSGLQKYAHSLLFLVSHCVDVSSNAFCVFVADCKGSFFALQFIECIKLTDKRRVRLRRYLPSGRLLFLCALSGAVMFAQR
jgi:hypothetical protein